MAINSFASLLELGAGLSQRDFTSVELTKHYLERIERANDKLLAFVSVDDIGHAFQRASDWHRHVPNDLKL